MDCGEKYEKAYTLGVIHYRGAPNGLPPSMVTYEDTHREGKVSIKQNTDHRPNFNYS